MWSKSDTVHYVKKNIRLSTASETWYTIETRHHNGLMKISHVNPAEEDVEETIEMVKSNHSVELTETMFKMNAEKLAGEAAEDIYESLDADFLDKFDLTKEEEDKAVEKKDLTK